MRISAVASRVSFAALRLRLAAEMHVERAERFLELLAALRADHRQDVIAPRAHPGHRQPR
jgi:hypothetical protein